MKGLSSFIPASAFDLYEKAVGGTTSCKRVSGAILFCDVAGFTPLTEALSVLGKEGAEELTRILNGYFTRMIGIIGEEGGDVLRFGGDAMTVLFPGDSAGPASRAAWRMMQAMGEFSGLETRAGTFKLSMKIGASAGQLLIGLVGNRDVGFDFYACGKPLDWAAEAEHRANPGLVVLHPSFCALGLSGIRAGKMDEGYALLESPIQLSHVFPSPHVAPPAEQLLERLVPPYLADRAGEGVLGEHRGTAVAFISFSGIELDCGSTGTNRILLAAGDPVADEIHGKLNGVYSFFASTAKRYGGVVNKVDMGDKGSKVILLFGAPYALEKKEEMAVHSAIELASSPERPAGLLLKMGITSAQLFSGPVGSPVRREFTVMGDGINLAARLMQAARPGEVLCDSGAAAGASRAFSFLELPAIPVKGKSDPVAIFQPKGKRERDETGGSTRQLIDRESPCEILDKYLFFEGGTPVAIAGEPGIGKTAMIEWARFRADIRQVPVTRVFLAPFSAERPFVAWRGLVRSVVGLKKGDPPERAREARDGALSGEPSGYRPLLNIFLDLPEEVTPALRNLSAKERKDLTFAIVGRLLDASGERVILQDNIQWADPLSLDLLSYLLQDARSAPWRLVASMRPGSDGAERAASGMARIELTPLTSPGIELYLREICGLSEVPPGVRDWFLSRSRGNPALVTALLSALEREGLLQRDTHGVRIDLDHLHEMAFPDTLEGLYLARVDHLPRREREVLQTAAILGSSVSFNLLKKVCGEERGDIRGALDELVKAGLLRPDTWGPRPYYRFCDALLRDAVYNAMPYALKREGHLKLALILEPEAGGNEKLQATLANHFEMAGDGPKAKHYHRLAGRDALGHFDNLTALKHLEYVVKSLGPEADDVEDAFSLMEIYGFLGRWENAKVLLSSLKAIRGEMGISQQARLCHFLARELWQQQKWGEAEGVLNEALESYSAAGDTAGIGKTYVNLVGGIYGPTGRLDAARQCLEKALDLAEGQGQAVWRAMAAMNLGAVLWHTGQTGSARDAFKEAYKLATRGRLGPRTGMIADNLCALLGEVGQFDEAAIWGRRAVKTLETFAIRGISLNARYNLALAYLAKGQAAKVADILSHVARSAATQGDTKVYGAACQGLTSAHFLAGNLIEAFASAGEALDVFQTLGNGRDYRFSLLSFSNLFYSLSDRCGASAYWEGKSSELFLRESPGDPVADRGLGRLRAWMDGGDLHLKEPELFISPGEESSPEENLERLLWVCEGGVEAGLPWAGKYLEKAFEVLETWPYFEARLRVLRVEAILKGGLAPGRKREALHLLSRSMGGVWGIRLLSQMWVFESIQGTATALRERAVRHLYHLHLHSSTHAWEMLLRFPEIRAVLKGRPSTSGWF